MKLHRIILPLAMLAAAPAANATPTDVAAGYINYMAGGWTGSYLRVTLSAPVLNPEACQFSDGYITDPTDQGNSLFNSMLLSAYMAHRQVSLTISGCSGGRPRIIAVVVLPN